jgi:hypothetical protein
MITRTDRRDSERGAIIRMITGRAEFGNHLAINVAIRGDTWLDCVNGMRI